MGAAESQPHVLMLGNPGAGKSTLLNCLSGGQSKFTSGISFGGGLTNKLGEADVCMSPNQIVKFLDVPGLADPELRGAACAAIHKALDRRDQQFKILFVVTLQHGRICNDEVTTINCVLDSCPDAIGKFGIIINQIPDQLLGRLAIQTNIDRVMTVFCKDSNGKTRSFPPYFLVPCYAELWGDDKVIQLPCHSKLLQWITDLPMVTISDNVDLIPVDKYNDLQKKMEGELERLRQDADAQQAVLKDSLNMAELQTESLRKDMQNQKDEHDKSMKAQQTMMEQHKKDHDKALADQRTQMEKVLADQQKEMEKQTLDSLGVPLSRIIKAAGVRINTYKIGGGGYSPRIYDDIGGSPRFIDGWWWLAANAHVKDGVCYQVACHAENTVVVSMGGGLANLNVKLGGINLGFGTLVNAGVNIAHNLSEVKDDIEFEYGNQNLKIRCVG